MNVTLNVKKIVFCFLLFILIFVSFFMFVFYFNDNAELLNLVYTKYSNVFDSFFIVGIFLPFLICFFYAYLFLLDGADRLRTIAKYLLGFSVFFSMISIILSFLFTHISK